MPDNLVEAKLSELSRAMQAHPFCGFDRQAACSAILTIRDEQRNLWIDAQADVECIYNDVGVINNLSSHRMDTQQDLMNQNLSALKLKVALDHPNEQEDLLFMTLRK
jgi:hypothetical protein